MNNEVKVWDISVEERDGTFKAAIDSRVLSMDAYKDLLSITGTLPDPVEVTGNYRIAFKGPYSEPYIKVYGVRAKGNLGKSVSLYDTEDINLLLSVNIFDILDTDGGLNESTKSNPSKKSEL